MWSYIMPGLPMHLVQELDGGFYICYPANVALTGIYYYHNTNNNDNDNNNNNNDNNNNDNNNNKNNNTNDNNKVLRKVYSYNRKRIGRINKMNLCC